MSPMMTLAQLAAWTGGQAVGDPSTRILRVHTDTRSIEPGDLFVALKGDRFDANTFLLQAQQHSSLQVHIYHTGTMFDSYTERARAGIHNLKLIDNDSARVACLERLLSEVAEDGFRAGIEAAARSAAGSGVESMAGHGCCSGACTRWPKPPGAPRRSATHC